MMGPVTWDSIGYGTLRQLDLPEHFGHRFKEEEKVYWHLYAPRRADMVRIRPPQLRDVQGRTGHSMIAGQLSKCSIEITLSFGGSGVDLQ